MRTIKRITLHNYLSHKDTTLDNLGDSVCIKGPNQSGKSNIYNAISLIHNNEDWPLEDLFVDKSAPGNVPAAEGFVEIEYSDGRIIRRSRTKTKNTYLLKYPNGDEEHLGTKLKAEDKINEFTGFIPMKLFRDDSKDKPVMVQMVPLDNTTPFMMSGVSPASVLQAINKLSNGHLYDAAKRLAIQDLTTKEAEQKAAKNQVTYLEKVLASYDETRIEAIKARIAEIQAAETTLKTQVTAWQQTLTALLNLQGTHSAENIAKAKDDIQVMDAKLKAWLEASNKVAEARTKLATTKQTLADLRSSVDNIARYKVQIENTKEQLKEAKVQVEICAGCGRPL